MTKGSQILHQCGVWGAVFNEEISLLLFAPYPLSANTGSPPQTECQSHVTFEGVAVSLGKLNF